MLGITPSLPNSHQPPPLVHRLTALLLFAFALLTMRAAAAPAPIRVVSQTVGTDELLLAIAEPAQIAALSHLSREPEFCAVAEQAKQFPALDQNVDVEGVLKHAPTLVLVANYSRAEIVAQMKRTGVRVLTIERYKSLEDSYANLRLIARELGPAAEARAERLITACESRVAALREKLRDVKPVRVIAPSTYGVMGGADTTFQDLCDHAGAENLAATLGKLRGHATPPNEQMLAWPIDKVVLASNASLDEALAPFKKLPPYQFMPAIRENRVALLKSYQLSSVTHHRIDAYEQLARALHPEIFK